MNRKRGIAGILVLLLALAICAGLFMHKQQDHPEEEKTEETVIPVIFLINPDTGENENEALVEAFNRQYEGIYRVQVEWIMNTAEGYRSKIKLLNAVDQLPAVITDAGFDADFYDLLLQYHRLVNLNSAIQKEPAWKEAVGEDQMNKMKGEDGGIFLSISTNTIKSYGGFYYNKALFEAAGIEQFPETWDEFFDCLEQLKQAGITPLAIHGESSYWTTMLIATGYLAGTEEGMEFLQQQYPENFDVPCMRDMFRFVKKLYRYSFEDALDIDRVDSTERFLAGEAAIMANGGWMIDNLTEEQKEQIGFASFPGRVLMKDNKMSGWAVTSGYSEAVTKGAIEFLKFRAIREKGQKDEYLEAGPQTPLEAQYLENVGQVQNIFPNYQLKWESQIRERLFVKEIPLYVTGKESEDAFFDSLNDEVLKIRQEK